MLSLAFIRENPDVVRHALEVKREDAPLDEILSLDRRRREVQTEHDALAGRLNQAQSALRSLTGAERQARQEELRALSERRKSLSDEVRAIEEQLEPLLLRVPNLPHEGVPVGESEADNVVIGTWGTPRRFDFTPRPHWEIGEQLDILDFERASKISGPRFVVFKGAGAD
jgi:seryl-tRNA synthetase